jgi:hypothetical protein
VLVEYGELIHTPRALMGLLGVAGLMTLALAAAARNRIQVPHRKEIFLLTGSAVALLLGSVAVVNPLLRYLVPAVPLLVCGGLLAARDLLAATAPRPAGTR